MSSEGWIRTTRVGAVEVAVMDAIAQVGAAHSGMVVVSGSHGGLSSGRWALRHPPRLVVFNDAGVGKDRAGIAALEQLEGFSIPAVAVAADSARIGDGEDTLAGGVVAHLNTPARALGLTPGSLREQLERLPANE